LRVTSRRGYGLFYSRTRACASSSAAGGQGHLIEIAFWAVLLVLCGEFQEFGTAYYHSAANYTTLGYGDLLLTPSWRLLGPLEAAAAALMFDVLPRWSLLLYNVWF
jgi:hypothetical protein